MINKIVSDYVKKISGLKGAEILCQSEQQKNLGAVIILALLAQMRDHAAALVMKIVKYCAKRFVGR